VQKTRDLAAENKVKGFYDGQGWDSGSSGDTVDAQLWEDLRPMAASYVSACRRRVLDWIPRTGDRLLDAASGPIQYPEYREYSAGYRKRVCVDISSKALEEAKRKLGHHAETICTSILDLPFDDSSFDAVVSLHTIYHIERDQQEAAVRQLLRVVRPGKPVVIIYSNPDRLLARIRRTITGGAPQSRSEDPLYFFAHPIRWWQRFEDVADVRVEPWRALTAEDSRRLVPGNKLGSGMLAAVRAVEDRLPWIAARLGAYPMIILTRR